MKNFNRFFIRSLIMIVAVFFGLVVNGQIIFTSIPDTTAILNETYTYDVNVTSNPPSVSFSLDMKPTGMIINSSSGIITWTPTSINQGGKVIVKATNSSGDWYQQFFVYVSDAVACPTGLNSYWDMDNVNGYTYYDNANDYDATFSGDVEPTLVTGKVGTAVQLAPQGNANTFLQVPDADQYEWRYDDDFTISLWFKNRPTALTEQPEVFIGRSNDQGSWWFGWDPSTLYVTASLTDRSGDNAMAVRNRSIGDTAWHHAALVYEGDNAGVDYIRLYLDKTVTTTSKSFSTGRFDGNGILTMGYWDEFGTNKFPFSGCLDEVAIFNKALSSTEINQLADRATAGNPVCQAGNYAPVFVSTPVTAVNEDSPYTYTVLGRDFEKQSLTYSALIKPSWLSFNPSTRVLSGTPANANVGDTTVTLQVTDGAATVTQTFTLTVSNINDLPQFTSTPVTAVDEDAVYSYTITAVDVDAGSSITYSAPVIAGWLSFNPATRLLSGIPTNDQVEKDPFADFNVTIRATDNTTAYSEQSFTIRVTNINDAPVITNKASVNTNEDTPIELTLSHFTVTDVDNVYPDDFTLSVKAGTNYTFSGNTVTPAQDYYGSVSVNFDLSDGSETLSDFISIAVNSVNDLPLITSAAKTTAKEGSLYTYVVSATDADLNPLTYTAEKNPSWMSFDPEEHVFAGTPLNANVGTDSVVVKVFDGTASVYQRFTVTVSNEINSTPEITSVPPGSVKVGETYAYEIVAEDEDPGDVITYSSVSIPGWMVFSASTGLLTGIPAAGNVGEHNIVLAASDGIETVEQTFTVLVNPASAINDIESDVLISAVYPVPAADRLFLGISKIASGRAEFIDFTGKVVKTVSIENANREVAFDVSELKSGIYFCRIIVNDESQIIKFIKE